MSVCYEIPRLPISARVWRTWMPRPRVSTWEWVCENVRDKDGTPFDGDRFPWCRGVFDAFDSPHVRMIALKWATRISKTFTGHAIHECIWATNPMPTMFCSSVEALAKATVDEELYPMLEHCPPLRDQLLPPARRSRKTIKLRDCSCRVAWAGSESRIASYGCFFLHANEVSKYPPSASGDRLNQLLERVQKQFPDYKALLESSPELTATCRITQIVAQSDDRQFQVPCPHCRAYQTLQLGDPSMAEPRGLVWDRTPAGNDDPELAYRTARYLCLDCGKEIEDESKYGANRLGVWCPKGQWVDKRGRLCGTAERPNCTTWGSQLSSLYSPNLRWADFARKKVECEPRPSTRQTFTNLWKGEDWEEGASKTEPEELGEKLEVPIPRGIVPAWASFVTCAVDRQDWGFELATYAWGRGERGHLVDHDVADTWDEVLLYLDRRWEQESGDRSQESEANALPAACRQPPATITMAPVVTLVDEGFKAKETRKFCKRNSTTARRILSAKGSSTHMNGEPYKKHVIGSDLKKLPKRQRRSAIAARGVVRVLVAIDYWEALIQDYFDIRKPDEPGSLSFFEGAGDDLDFCKQLLNGCLSTKLNKRNYSEFLWVKRWPDFPNDQRDILRYARCAAEVWARGRWDRRSVASEQQASEQQAAGGRRQAAQGRDQGSGVRGREKPPPAKRVDLEQKPDETPADEETRSGFIRRRPGPFIRRRR